MQSATNYYAIKDSTKLINILLIIDTPAEVHKFKKLMKNFVTIDF